MTTCSATTAAGNPCKNHAVKGAQLCKAHRGRPLGGSAMDIRHGAPPANINSVKHGFYRPTILEDEYAEQFDLADELAISRVRLRRIMTTIDGREDALDPDQYGRLTALIYTAVSTATKPSSPREGSKRDGESGN